MDKYDVIVVGAGIGGLAHALAAVRRGLKVCVIERDHRCVGASIRNFGFITVTGQGAGDTWRRAMQSRDIWQELAPKAGIEVLHRGLWMLARRPAAAAVLEAFVQTQMGIDCRLYAADRARGLAPFLNTDGATAALYSPHELRVESRTAIPLLARYLEHEMGVRFVWGQEVLQVEPPCVTTATGTWNAERIVLCPGTVLTGVARPWLEQAQIKLTRLQMLRVRPAAPLNLAAAVMSDLGLVRYRGYAELPEAASLLAQLRSEEADSLAAGIHLIAVQSGDGSLVVGDSHHDDATPWPFASEAVDELILRHLQEAVVTGPCRVAERWTGFYPTGYSDDVLIKRPSAQLRVVVVTSGTGASTGFGIAEDVFKEW